MNVYQFSEPGWFDWVAAGTKKEAIRIWISLTEVDWDTAEKLCCRVLKDEAQKMVVVDPTCYRSEEMIPADQRHLFSGGYPIEGTVWQIAQDLKHGDIIATSEY